MTNIEPLLKGDSSEWWKGLPVYQQQLVSTLLQRSESPLDAAERWLSAAPKDTYPFGGVRAAKPFLDKLLDEVEYFLCGDPKYNDDRTKLAMESKPTHAYIVGAISVSIAPVVGASAPFVAPVVALLLMTTAKLGLNAWCNMRKEARLNRSSTSIS